MTVLKFFDDFVNGIAACEAAKFVVDSFAPQPIAYIGTHLAPLEQLMRLTADSALSVYKAAKAM